MVLAFAVTFIWPCCGLDIGVCSVHSDTLFSGTTLNLLKFPVVDPSPRRLAKRAERLAKDQTVLAEELRQQQLNTKGDKQNNPTLIGAESLKHCGVR